jgi:exopolysaccharide production protein ExoZ
MHSQRIATSAVTRAKWPLWRGRHPFNQLDNEGKDALSLISATDRITMAAAEEPLLPLSAGHSADPVSGIGSGWAQKALHWATYEFESAGGRILPLEGLRGFAALLVFFVHFSSLLGPYARPQSLLWTATHFAASLGNCGVDIFFVISGFLMYGIVMRKPTPFLRYLGRRAKRLYPVFVFVLLLYIAMSYFLPIESRIPAAPGPAVAYILANLAMLPGMLSIKPLITVAWSLSYEWFFYLALPLTVWGLKLRGWTPRARIALVLTICVCQYVLCVFHVSGHPRLIMFGAGVCLWEIGTNWKLDGHLGWRGEWAAIALAAASLAWVGFNGMHHGGNAVGRMSILPTDTPVLFIGVSPLVFYGLHFQGLLNRFFSITGLRWVGNISYSYYLIHGFTLHVVARMAHRWLGNRLLSPLPYAMLFVFSLAATIVVAALLFWAIERPLSLSPAAKGGKERSPASVQPADAVRAA